MSEASRIIERDRDEVNGTRSCCDVFFSTTSRRLALVVVLLALVAALPGCGGRESKAEALYDRAMKHVDAGDLPAAVELFERIERDYGETVTARRAHEAVLLYAGLEHAVTTYPARRARDMMVRTARAIQRGRSGRRGWPSSLDRLMPHFLGEPPIDPWGRPLIYEPKTSGRGYVLQCLGSDGRPGGAGEAADLVVEDGEFVRDPTDG